MSIYEKTRRALSEGGVVLIFTRLFNKVRWSKSKLDYLVNVKHKLNKRLPDVNVQFRPIPETSKNDVLIAQRILHAFNKAREDENKDKTGDIWDRIQERHADFYTISHDPVKVAGYMNNMNQHNITLGISSSTLGEYQNMKKYPMIRQGWGVYVKDLMVCLAEAVGALPYNRTERGRALRDTLYQDGDVMLDRIEAKIGAPLMPSGVEGGLYKTMIKGHPFDHKDSWSIYIAWRIRELVGTEATVAEIGGGIGKAALFAGQLGIGNYSIYDLPIINLVQAWYLIKSGVTVELYGEEQTHYDNFTPAPVRILPYWEFRNDSFDITVNTDSFPEMDESIVADYLETIKRNTKQYLLSINQEEAGVYMGDRRHVVVPDVVAKVGGFKRIYRLPFWFLENYVEELYKPVG